MGGEEVDGLLEAVGGVWDEEVFQGGAECGAVAAFDACGACEAALAGFVAVLLAGGGVAGWENWDGFDALEAGDVGQGFAFAACAFAPFDAHEDEDVVAGLCVAHFGELGEGQFEDVGVLVDSGDGCPS